MRRASGIGKTQASKRRRGKKGLPSIVQRKDSLWALTIHLGRGPDGKPLRYQRTCKTYEDALEAARAFDYETALRSGQTDQMEVGTLVRAYLRSLPSGEHRTEMNRQWLAAHVERLLGPHRIGGLTTDHIETMLEKLKKEKYTPSTRAKILTLLRQALRSAVGRGWITSNPAQDMATPRISTALPEEAWTQQEVTRILASAGQGRLFPLLLVAFATGARIGELLALRVQDYDAKTGTLHIRGTAKRGGGRGPGKTPAADRNLPLSAEVQEVLEAHLRDVAQWRQQAGPLWGQRQAIREETRAKQRRAARAQLNSGLPEDWVLPPPEAAPYEPLFPTLNGTPWLAGNVRKHWMRVLQGAGIPYRRFHSLRAAFITAALQDAQVSVTDIQLVVGHTSARQTFRYAQQVRGHQDRVLGAVVRGLGLGSRPLDEARSAREQTSG